LPAWAERPQNLPVRLIDMEVWPALMSVLMTLLENRSARAV
jgi:hypothetical protein